MNKMHLGELINPLTKRINPDIFDYMTGLLISLIFLVDFVSRLLISCGAIFLFVFFSHNKITLLLS